MTSGQKTAVSLLTTVLIFAAFTVLAFTGLFSVIDARFYEPEKITQIQKHLDVISENYNEYVSVLESRFGKNENSFLKQKAVQSYISNRPTDEEVRIRSKLAGDLFSQTPGLLGMRLIDKNGVNVHFSTFSSDVLNRSAELVSYKNYSESLTLSGVKEIPFEKINSPDSYSSGTYDCRTIFDGKDNRIIISFPFYDSYSAYRGSFVFYVNANDFNRVLLSKKLITFGDTGTLVSGFNAEAENTGAYKSGFVFGIPSVGRELFEKEILDRWEKGLTTPEKIVYSKSGSTFDVKEYDSSLAEAESKNNYWVLVSSVKTSFGYVGGIYPDSVFVMPDGVKILLLVCIFVTLFLVVFLLLNLRQDEMVVIRERIRRLQLGIINEYLKKKETVDWKVVSGQIAERRNDVTLEIIRSLGKKAKKHDKEVNELINASWDELLTAMSVQSKREESDGGLKDAQQIKTMLEELLSSGSIKVQAVGAASGTAPAAGVASVASAASGTVASATPVASSAAPVSSVASADDVEELDEVEELGEAEELDEVEEIAEVESADEVEELGEVEELEEVESIEDAEPVEDAEAVEEAESADDVEELSEEEELVEAEPAEEAPEATAPAADTERPTEFHESEIPQFERHAPETELKSSDDVEIINREAFALNRSYDEDDDQIINNFAVYNPDFSGLDEMESDPEAKLNGTRGQTGKDKSDIILESNSEDVAVDQFVKFEDEPEELKEKIDFGSVDNTPKTSPESVKFDVEPSMLDFKMLDKSVVVKHPHTDKAKNIIGESTYSVKNIQNEVQAQSIAGQEEVSELSPVVDSVPFSLTQFGAVSAAVQELESDINVIREDESGVFVIEADGTEKAPEDMAFKELVDSVLNV